MLMREIEPAGRAAEPAPPPPASSSAVGAPFAIRAGRVVIRDSHRL